MIRRASASCHARRRQRYMPYAAPPFSPPAMIAATPDACRLLLEATLMPPMIFFAASCYDAYAAIDA